MADMGKLPNKTITDGDWRMSIIAQPWLDIVDVWIGHYQNGKAYSLNLREDGTMLETEMKEGSVEGKPFLRIPLRIYEQFAQLFNKAELPVEQEATQAELKATKFHLEDMRNLVFKRRPSTSRPKKSKPPALPNEEPDF